MAKNPISIKNVSKVYRIFDNPTDRFLKQLPEGSVPREEITMHSMTLLSKWQREKYWGLLA